MRVGKYLCCGIVYLSLLYQLIFAPSSSIQPTSFRLKTMEKKVASRDKQLLEEKKRRRAAVAKAVERRRAVENTVEDLYEWIDELSIE